MAEQLKVTAYALSLTGNKVNLDNMYMNGRYNNVAGDPETKMTRSVAGDFQVYGVSDSEIGVGEDRSQGIDNGNIVMDMLQRTHNSLNETEKINKDHIWEAIVDANQQTRERCNQLGKDVLGTSFAALFLHGNRGLAVHLGDSRIYVIRNGRMLQITDDHLESSDMFKLGILTQAQSEVHKEDSRLTAYVGMDDVYDAHDEAFSKYFIFYPQDTFILCTDGVSDAISNEEMERIARLLKDAEPEQLASMLMKTAAEKSQEDMTIMVLSIDNAPGEAPKRGTGTIPRKENYEKAAADPQKTRTSIAPRPRPEEEMTEAGAQEAETENDFREAPVEQAPRRLRSVNEDPDPMGEEDYDDEGSLLDKLMANPKRLAIIAGGAVVIIILLIIIIKAIAGGGKSNDNSVVAPAESSNIESSVVIPTPVVQESSKLTSQESSVPDNSSDNSDDNSSTAATPEGDTYTVQEGDSFYGIVSSVYGTADVELIDAFCAYNGMTIETALMPGDVLKTPPLSELQGN